MDIASRDYGKLFQSVSVDKEINPICMNIEDMLTRLEELESLLANVKGESNVIMDQYASSILAFGPHLNGLKQRIDNLEQFVETVDSNVDEMEKSLDLAEAELNVTDYSLKGLLAKAISGTPSTGSVVATEESISASNMKNGEFQPVSIFNSSQFFDSATVINNKSG